MRYTRFCHWKKSRRVDNLNLIFGEIRVFWSSLGLILDVHAWDVWGILFSLDVTVSGLNELLALTSSTRNTQH